MLLDQVEVVANPSILGQDAHRPAGFGEDRLQAPPADLMLLRLRGPGIDQSADLHETALLDPASVPGDTLRRRRIDYGVAIGEGVFAAPALPLASPRTAGPRPLSLIPPQRWWL